MKYKKTSLLLGILLLLALYWKTRPVRSRSAPLAPSTASAPHKTESKPQGAPPPVAAEAPKSEELISAESCKNFFDLYPTGADQGFKCVDEESWGSYEMRGFKNEKFPPTVEVLLQIDREEFSPLAQDPRKIEISVRVQKIADEGQKQTIYSGMLPYFFDHRDQVTSFMLNVKNPVIEDFLKRQLFAPEGRAAASFTRLSEMHVEYCFHPEDSQQWIETRYEWTNMRVSGRVKWPNSERFVKIKKTNVPDLLECVYEDSKN